MLYYIIACFGLTCILKYGTILNRIRVFLCKNKILKDLFDCSLCLGFWSGVILGIHGYLYTYESIFHLLPLISAGMCWVLDSTIRVIQTIELYLDKRLENDK